MNLKSPKDRDGLEITMNQQHGIASIILPWLILILTPFLISTLMVYDGLSDDQVAYLYVIDLIGSDKQYRPLAFGTNLLYWLSEIGLTIEQTLNVYFIIAAVLYLCAMYWMLGQVFLLSRWISVLIAVVSLAPIYTLGMTYWGFARYEMILPRILALWMIPLCFGWAIKWRSGRAQWVILIVAASGVFFNLSAVYFLLSLAFFITLSAFRQGTWLLGLWTILVTIVILYVVNAAMVGHLIYNDTPLSYFYIEERWSDLVGVLGKGNHVIALQWEAANTGFWWTLFPPRLIDIAYFGAGAFFVMVYGVAGLRQAIIRGSNEYRDLLLFAACVMAVAYGYQLCRFVAWQTLDWGPYFVEEVRTFRLMMLPLYVGSGWFLMSLHRRRRYFLLLICALTLAAPITSVIRWLPEDVRGMIAASTHKAFPAIDAAKMTYIAKALNIQDKKSSREDLLTINALLRTAPFPDQCVISTEHRLKSSGRPIILSYHDKRGGRRIDNLVKWYLVYSYVTAALQSRDALQILQTAELFDCKFVVTDYMMDNPNLSVEHAGMKYFLYRVIPRF